MDKKPLKRHKALQPLSRQHHFGLLFSWKLRQGLNKKIELERLQKYAKWFYKTEIAPHFEAEEAYLFPILDSQDPLVLRALEDHRQIRILFNDSDDSEALQLLENKLETHIRFEERELFVKIQSVATEEQMAKIDAIHIETTPPDYDDAFWEK